MKTLMILIAAISLQACSGMTSRAQPLEAAEKLLDAHAVKTTISRTFCEGDGFAFYSENSRFYSFRCKGGGYFSLPK